MVSHRFRSAAAPDTGAGRRVSFRQYYWAVGLLVVGYLGYLGYYHWGQRNTPILRTPVIFVSFAWMIIILLAAHFNKPHKGVAPVATRRKVQASISPAPATVGAAKTSALRTMIVVPNHNEDPEMFREMLDSFTRQTVTPYAVCIVENGKTNGKCRTVFDAWAAEQAVIPNVLMDYREQAGKRGAQGHAFSSPLMAEADIVITVDGDTELAPNAIEEGLKPFADPQVMSVAGLLVGKNAQANTLTRLVDLGFVSSFMNGRAAWSTFRSVAVNCGGLAFYRSWVVTKHLDEYLGQRIFGNEVNSGDDRMLTAFAALEGKTVFQETSVGYTLLPENMKHLTKQRIRWWRSFWWGGIWLLRRFNPSRAIWWLVLSQYITFVLYAAMIPLILVADPIRTHHFPWQFFAYVAGLSYIRMARTLKVKRADQSTLNQVLTYAIGSPFVTVLNLWLCTTLQFVGGFTFWKTGWMTRKKVEVALTK